MAVLGTNTCEPQRIYGPLSHTLFMGCSIKSFQVSAGWNEQASNLTVELAEDPCVANKIYWDQELNRQEAEIADPGFPRVDPGVPVYFRVEEDPSDPTDKGGFEYCGLVQSWTESFDSNGNPQYTVQVTDPRVILENTQVIVNNFPGGTSGVWNLINAYGYVESLGSTCTSSPAGAIGGVTFDNPLGMIANERGMLWNDLKCAIHTLTASVDRALSNSLYGSYCRDTRLVYVGPTGPQQGYGVLEGDAVIADAAFQTIPNANLNICDYMVDLTELPFAPSDYRISGPNISLMEIISQVCDDSGCDYYIELLPIKNAGKVLKVIKVRVAVRSSQPQVGRLDDYIAAKQAQAQNANGGVISYQKGEEVRNEQTSIYLMGGERRDKYEVDNSDMLPFWGVDIEGNLIQATVVGGEYRVRLDARRLNTTLFSPFSTDFIWVSESELRASLAEIDSWKFISHIAGLAVSTWFDDNGVRKKLNENQLKDFLAGNVQKMAAVLPHIDFEAQVGEDIQNDIDKIFNFIKSFTDEFYGKKFLARSSFVCFAQDLETEKYRYSHEPSTEGCWVEDATTQVIGLTHDSAASDFFRDETGKYQAIVRYPATAGFTFAGAGGSLVADPSVLGDDNYITDNSTSVWAKADVDSRWLFGIPQNPSSSVVSFVLTVAAPVTNRQVDDGAGNKLDFPQGAFAEVLADLGDTVPPINWIDRPGATLGIIGAAISPNAALCPTWNHVQVYGPWGVAGLPGQVRLETDAGMVPWEFGSDTVMYTAALDKVSDAVTQMRKGERGSVTVAGFPNIPLGAELFSVDTSNPPNSMGNQKYVETRTYSAAQCAPIIPFVYCAMNAWTGEFGPNVTNINVNVGSQGFTTQYQFSTYTPRYGRFNKDNAERLKQIGQSRLQNNRNLRAMQTLSRQIAAGKRRRQYIEDKVGKSRGASKSCHPMFMGRITDANRNEAFTISANDSTVTFPSTGAYSQSAVMSFDGLIRPVSKAGDGGLPRFVVPTNFTCSGVAANSKMSDPPVNEYDGIAITQTYLDPLANPNDDLQTLLSDTPATGHDIETLGRLTDIPANGWCIKENEDAGASGYEDDYRFFALRGPLLIQQWGYDDCDKPVPNKADVEADTENGTFVTANLEDKFLDGWLKKPKTWPVAPLDLRLDRERGVWTVPQPPRNMHIDATGCLLIHTGNLDVVNSKTIYKADGSTLSNPKVDVKWPWTVDPPSGIGKIPVYYDNVDCEYYAYPVNRLDVQVSGTGGPIAWDIKRIVFGSGFNFVASGDNDDCLNYVHVSAEAEFCFFQSGTCGETTDGDKTCFTTLAVGSGLQIADGGGNTGTLNLRFLAEGSDKICGGSPVGPIAITGIVFGTGIATTQRDCAIAIDSPLVAKQADTACGRTAIGSVDAVTGLNWGRGFNWGDMYDAGNCSLLIETYHRITGKTALNDCHDKYPLGTSYDDTFEKLNFVGRLSVTQDGAGCEYTVSGMQPLFSIFGSKDIAGQSGNLSGLNGDPTYPLGCVTDWDNVLCNRTIPEATEGLIGGRGVGIAGCNGDQNDGTASTACATVLFLNAMVFGYDNACQEKKFLQVAETKYRDEFSVFAVNTHDNVAGNACDGFDGSLAVEVQLSEKSEETWTMNFVKCIKIITAGGYVTDIECDMGTIGGTKSCGPADQFLWIKANSTGNPACTLTTPPGTIKCT